MPTISSKPKDIGSMASRSRGRVFCVTGVQGTGYQPTEYGKYAVSPITKSTNGQHNTTTNLIGYSDTESNTSGYLSSSSFESSGEEKRLAPNVNKVFQLWDKLGERVRIPSGPKSSTPKQGSETLAYKKRTAALQTEQGRSLLAIKRNLSGNSQSGSTTNDDSFWGIKTPQVQKSSSEGDIRKSDNLWKRKPIHDAGLDIDTSRTSNVSASQDWKRRPFLTQSTSEHDLRVTSQPMRSNRSQRHSDDYSHFSALPRYRVKVYDPACISASDSNLASKLCKSCADFADEGRPVDESMTEFLSNVDEENLAGFLNFYDRVTSSSAYERAKRNTKNYEAVYY